MVASGRRGRLVSRPRPTAGGGKASGGHRPDTVDPHERATNHGLTELRRSPEPFCEAGVPAPPPRDRPGPIRHPETRNLNADDDWGRVAPGRGRTVGPPPAGRRPAVGSVVVGHQPGHASRLGEAGTDRRGSAAQDRSATTASPAPPVRWWRCRRRRHDGVGPLWAVQPRTFGLLLHVEKRTGPHAPATDSRHRA